MCVFVYVYLCFTVWMIDCAWMHVLVRMDVCAVHVHRRVSKSMNVYVIFSSLCTKSSELNIIQPITVYKTLLFN